MHGPQDPPAAAPADLPASYRSQLAQRGFASDPAQATVLAALDDLRQRLLAYRRPPPLLRGLRRLTGRTAAPAVRGLYLWGSVGRGKTWLMDLFYDSLPFAARRRRHFHRFMQETHEQLRRLQHLSNPLERLAADTASEIRVLCFDELFVTDIADAMILGGLFAALLRHGVTLVATSNVPPEKLYADGLQRQRFLPTIALLRGQLDVLQLTGDNDYRLRQLRQAGTWLPAADPATPARLAALFRELAGPGAHGADSISVAGRPIAVRGVGGGAVWFEFATLCAGARSALDYIAIAHEYQAVLLEGVPVMDELTDDAARRFITLVDEFYDRNVKLVISAAAAPQELYRGSRLSAQFARTASRLTEMQSIEYLARAHR
ncbi:MAG: AFG1 family ATPase [Proteobacteria bacterium]|nr:AFG1 family ATPase [Pseudomonadota bacterium]